MKLAIDNNRPDDGFTFASSITLSGRYIKL